MFIIIIGLLFIMSYITYGEFCYHAVDVLMYCTPYTAIGLQ